MLTVQGEDILIRRRETFEDLIEKMWLITSNDIVRWKINHIKSWNKRFSIKVAKSQKESFEEVERIHDIEDINVIWKFSKHKTHFRVFILNNHIPRRISYWFVFEIQNQFAIWTFFSQSGWKILNSFVFTVFEGCL